MRKPLPPRERFVRPSIEDKHRSHPDAVVEDENGHLTVDYRGLNVSLQAA